MELWEVKRSPKCEEKSMRKLASKKVGPQNARGQTAVTKVKVVARRGLRGEVNLPPRRGVSEEREKIRKEEGKKEGKED